MVTEGLSPTPDFSLYQMFHYLFLSLQVEVLSSTRLPSSFLPQVELIRSYILTKEIYPTLFIVGRLTLLSCLGIHTRGTKASQHQWLVCPIELIVSHIGCENIHCIFQIVIFCIDGNKYCWMSCHL